MLEQVLSIQWVGWFKITQLHSVSNLMLSSCIELCSLVAIRGLFWYSGLFSYSGLFYHFGLFQKTFINTLTSSASIQTRFKHFYIGSDLFFQNSSSLKCYPTKPYYVKRAVFIFQYILSQVIQYIQTKDSIFNNLKIFFDVFKRS